MYMLTVFIVLFIIIIIIISMSINQEPYDNLNGMDSKIIYNPLFVPVDNNYGRYYSLRY